VEQDGEQLFHNYFYMDVAINSPVVRENLPLPIIQRIMAHLLPFPKEKKVKLITVLVMGRL
jgi:hypothetical protein